MLTPHGWLEVRTAAEGDYYRVAALHRRCYPQEEWTAPDVRSFADKVGNEVKVMCLDAGCVIGTLLYRTAGDTVRVARLAVQPCVRRNRVAAFALRTLTGPRGPLRSGVYEARVHETNAPAVALMRMVGFDAVGIDREHYRDGRDAYVFRLHKEAPVRHRPLVRA